jgi:hypothetical protein
MNTFLIRKKARIDESVSSASAPTLHMSENDDMQDFC